MTDLKPCPFCGGEASTNSSRFDSVSIVYNTSCMSCSSGTSEYLTEKEAIDAWNRRVECSK